MKLNELNKLPEAKRRKIVGRGPASGMGKTSTRGENGQKSRSGASIKPWFRGGESPIYRRIPKRGFNNIFATEYAVVNLSTLNDRFEDGATVDAQSLKDAGVIKKALDGVKVLGKGEITKAITVKVAAISESAKAKIEAAGGKVEVL